MPSYDSRTEEKVVVWTDLLKNFLEKYKFSSFIISLFNTKTAYLFILSICIFNIFRPASPTREQRQQFMGQV